MFLSSFLRAALPALCVVGVAADVVVLPGGVPKAHSAADQVKTVDEFFRKSVENEFYNNSAQVLMSSFDMRGTKLSADEGLRPSGDSFVRGAIQAWGEHLHLVIRPDEVWFTILVQMNFYMNSHAEELRDMFVNHEGQEVIYIEDYTWYDVVRRFQYEIQDRVKTDWLRDWILPGFTTSTESDEMTANILMMGLVKAFFKYEGGIVCGLPSVTLLGEKSDWEALLKKIDRLTDFGAEPTAYKARLQPLLSRFVTTFDEPDSPEIRKFWAQIVSAQSWTVCGGPPFYISGWITGFHFWTYEGDPFYQRADGDLEIDGQTYPRVDITRIPNGYAQAPFIMRDFNNTARYEAYVLSGNLGTKITAGYPAGYKAAVDRLQDEATLKASALTTHSTLQPLSHWLLYGPRKHNATAVEWFELETERTLVSSLRSNYNEGQCVLKP